MGDDERADEIADESLEDYAERRKFELVNPNRSIRTMATKRELEERISELEDENQELYDQLDDIAAIASPADEDEDEDEDDGSDYDEGQDDDSGN